VLEIPRGCDYVFFVHLPRQGHGDAAALSSQGVYYVAGSRTAGFWETAHFHLPPPRVSWSTAAAAGPLGPPGCPWGPSVRIATYELGVCDAVRIKSIRLYFERPYAGAQKGTIAGEPDQSQ
jgi:hypothetical protein